MYEEYINVYGVHSSVCEKRSNMENLKDLLYLSLAKKVILHCFVNV